MKGNYLDAPSDWERIPSNDSSRGIGFTITLIAIAAAIVTLISIVILGVTVNRVSSLSTSVLSYISIILVILTIVASIFVIIETVIEKRSIRDTTEKYLTPIKVTLKIDNEVLSIETPDVESATRLVENFQADYRRFAKKANVLKEQQERYSETSDSPDAAGNTE